MKSSSIHQNQMRLEPISSMIEFLRNKNAGPANISTACFYRIRIGTQSRPGLRRDGINRLFRHEHRVNHINHAV